MRAIGRVEIPWPALLAIVLAACNRSPKETAPAPAKPASIILVTVDGWWDPRAKTSSIPDAMVPNEVRLTDAMTPSPQLRPAVSAIFTGKSAVETGVRNDVTTPLASTVPRVTQSLRARGWRTAAFVADPRVGIGSGLESGFEVFDPPKEILFGSFRRIPRVRAPREVVRDFARWVESLPGDAPYFAWIQISRPTSDSKGDSADEVRPALTELSKMLAATPRLSEAAVAMVGSSGKIDPDDGEHSGYFLNPDVLRVPALLRSGRATPANASAPFSLVELAGWIRAEAGIPPDVAGATPKGEPLLAWTWRGRDEFGWPAEVAAQHGTALCVHAAPEADDRCEPWGGAVLEESDRQACLSALARQPGTWAEPLPVPSLPKTLLEQLARSGLRARPGALPPRRSVARPIRASVVASVMKARRIESDRKAGEADAEYQRALARDPGNFGALIEAGEALANGGQAKPARARLDRALQLAPSHPEVWHWLGHVSYLETQLDPADLQWQVSDALRSGNADVLYDLACSRSIMGRIADSDAYLRRAWAAGFKDVNKIQVDSDLRNLRSDPSFLRFMREVVH